ncbi:hypothetical protein [Gelidibacter sp. F63206]|uniref:hypothetical protein n=1 Tax=Gelidibacter sp. F63206 TaxID=2926425 RepID=UPI001FF1364E|nr:hypothetical protein [Gelidibacter sp. F63206]MCK0114929.1 hypothetical protein [Gelidibacter sp. F63206]
MTIKKIDHIGINDLFWIHIRPHLWSFSFKGIPSQLHFTFAKNNKSGINFHITKNINDPKYPNKKPFIPILEIDKEVISSDLNSLFLKMFFGMLNEINVKENSEFTFLSFEDLNKDKSFGVNSEEFFKSFEEVSKITQKTRLKVNEGWTDKLMELTQSDRMIDLINENTKEIDKSKLKEIDSGILLSDDKTLCVIKVYDKWYELSTYKKPIEMFKQVIDEQHVKFIWYNIKRSIVILKSVNSWKETENRYEPIEIILNK